MANNEPIRPSGVYSYKQAREVDKAMQSQPTTFSYHWRDIRTGGTVYFNHH